MAPERLTAEGLMRIPSGLVLFVGLATLAARRARSRWTPSTTRYAWWPPDPADWPEEADAAAARDGADC